MKNKRKSTKEIMQMVTDIVIDGLNNEIVPWIKPWTGGDSRPYNLSSKTFYNGTNVWLLTAVQMKKGFTTNAWLTYQGAKKLGGSVRKGEKGSPVIFWKFLKKEQTLDNGDIVEETIPFLRYHSVFNVDQCDGIEVTPEDLPECDPIQDAVDVIDSYVDREEPLTFNEVFGSRAYYSPSDDQIVVPKIEQAVKKAIEIGQTESDGKQHHYSTCFHEMVHSTGHKDRLNRDSLTGNSYFGSHEYSKEELVAEMGSAILCQSVGMTSERVMENTTAYCKGWAKKLKDQPSWIVWAGNRAEKAVNYILEGGN